MIERRAYGKVYRTFWTDPEIRGELTASQKLLLVYYYSSPSGNMIGLYHAPFSQTAEQTGIRLDAVKRWTLHALKPWVTYDPATQEILIHNGARAALEANLHGTDNRRKAVERLLAAAHSTKLRARFLLLYADWGLQVVDPIKEGSPPEGASEALSSPSGSSSSRRSRSSSRSKTTSVATQPGQSPRVVKADGPTDGELMGLIRQKLYVPDKKAPVGYNDARDITVLRALRKQGLTGYQLADAIEGLAMLRDRGELDWAVPGSKMTLRGLYNTRHGVRPLLYQAQEAVYQATKRAVVLPSEANTPEAREFIPRGPEHIGDALKRVVPHA